MSFFSNILKPMPEYREILNAAVKNRLPAAVDGLAYIHKAHFAHSISSDLSKKALIIVPDEGEAFKFAEDLNYIDGGAYVYPARDFTLRSVEGQSREYEHARLGVLGRMVQGDFKYIICSAEAAMQLTLPPDELKNRTAVIKDGQETPPALVVEALLKAGYVRSEQVEGTGQFALRGGILDFFPPDSKAPFRIEFWGDNVDSISKFEIESQRRTESMGSVKITPATEVLFDSQEDLAREIEAYVKRIKGKAERAKRSFEKDVEKIRSGIHVAAIDRYLPLAYENPGNIFQYHDDGILLVCESVRVKERARTFLNQHFEDIKALLESGSLAAGLDKYVLDYGELVENFENKGSIYLETFSRGKYDTKICEITHISAKQLSPWGGGVKILCEDLEPALDNGYACIVMAGAEKSAKTLAQDLQDKNIKASYYETLPDEPGKAMVSVISGGVSAGFEYPRLKVSLITHGKMAGGKSKKRKIKTKPKERFNSLEELQRGDYVVHSSHGIGIFDGIHKMEIQGIVKDYIKIKYARGDTLYVPVTQLDLVSKYIGPKEDSTVKLHRLGGAEWQKSRAKVRKAVKDMAGELIKLYSERMNTKGHAFLPDTDLQNDFESRFEYEETEDQLRSAVEIKRDMQRSAPMDRLLCGDVGFGKTEVALRAAFKCVLDGKQCAFLVPTTILALQHYHTVLKRMENMPVSIEMISRFRSQAQQSNIIKELSRGNIDIIIGTHRLVSKDVRFKDLGLLIVDEEQRFGVAQKEKLKELFPTVDVLTLSATPIPRTLNMAMSGIRDMSILEEAPQDRHPVQTYVMEYEYEVLLDAMRKELRRGGQTYYLHNRVDNIDRIAYKISQSIPEASVSVAHGKMGEEELSEVWRRLLEGEIDILVCTTIIETGVDVSNVNTLIIEDSDRMGLSQLHQLRGRVGRSARRAFAYLTFNRSKALSEVATRRLSAIREFTEFGSGYKIALRDLEIRGAGNILGGEQHGHMEAVGYDMYIKLLNEAVKEERGEKDAVEDKECLIDLQVEAHIPEKYIESVQQRLAIYRRIANVRTSEDAEDVYDELIDRFGDPPKSVSGLVEISLLRNRAAALDIVEIGQKSEELLLYLSKLNMERLSKLANGAKGRTVLKAGQKPCMSVKLKADQQPMDALKEILDIMSK